MKSAFITIFAVFFSLSANAHNTAKIKDLLFYEAGNLIYIYPEGGVQNPPPCHGANGDYISYSLSRPMAKEYLSGLLTAFTTQKTVNFSTTGDCTDQSVSETLRYFIIHR